MTAIVVLVRYPLDLHLVLTLVVNVQQGDIATTSIVLLAWAQI